MDPFTEVRKLAGRASHDGCHPLTLPPFLLSVNLPAQWPESACARVRRVGVRESSLELGGAAGSLFVAVVCPRFFWSYPADKALRGKF